MAYDKLTRQRLISLSLGLAEHALARDESFTSPLYDLVNRYVQRGVLSPPDLVYPGMNGYNEALGAAMESLTRTVDESGVFENRFVRVQPQALRADVEQFIAELDAAIDTLPRQAISLPLAQWYQDEKRGPIYRERIDQMAGAVHLDTAHGTQARPHIILPDISAHDILKAQLGSLADDLRVVLPANLYRGAFRDQLMAVVRDNGGFRDQILGDRVGIWVAKPETKRALDTIINDYRIAKLGPNVKNQISQYLSQGFVRSYFERRREQQLAALLAQREELTDGTQLEQARQLSLYTFDALAHRERLANGEHPGANIDVEQEREYARKLAALTQPGPTRPPVERIDYAFLAGIDDSDLAQNDAIDLAYDALQNGSLNLVIEPYNDEAVYQTPLRRRLERLRSIDQQMEPLSKPLTAADYAREDRVRALIDSLSADELESLLRQGQSEVKLAKTLVSERFNREEVILDLAQRICFDDAWENTPNFLADSAYARALELQARRGKGRVDQPRTKTLFSRQPPYDRTLLALQSMSLEGLQQLVTDMGKHAEQSRTKIERAVERTREQMVRELQQRLREGKGDSLRGSLARGLDVMLKDGVNRQDLVNAALSENESIARQAFAGKNVRGQRDAFAESELSLDEIRTLLTQEYLAGAETMHDLHLREATIRAISATAKRNDNGALDLPKIVMLERQQQPSFLAELPGQLAAAKTARFSGRPVAIFGLNEQGYVQRFSPYAPQDDQKHDEWEARNLKMQLPLIAVLEQGEPRLTATNAFGAIGLAVDYRGDSWLHNALRSAFVERYAELVQESNRADGRPSDADAQWQPRSQQKKLRELVLDEFGALAQLFQPEDRDVFTRPRIIEPKAITTRHRLARAVGDNLYHLLHAQDVRTVGRASIETAFIRRYEEIVREHATAPEDAQSALKAEFGPFINLLGKDLRTNIEQQLTVNPPRELAYAMAQHVYDRVHHDDPDAAAAALAALPSSLRYIASREPQQVRETFTALPASLRGKVSKQIIDTLAEFNPQAIRNLYQSTGRYAVLDLASLGEAHILSAYRVNEVVDRPVFDYRANPVWGDRDAFIASDYNSIIEELFASTHLGLPIGVSLNPRTQQIALQLFKGQSMLRAEREITEFGRSRAPQQSIDGFFTDIDPQMAGFLQAVKEQLRAAGNGVYQFRFQSDNAPEIFKSKEALSRQEDKERALDGRAESLGEDAPDPADGREEAAHGENAVEQIAQDVLDESAMAERIAQFAHERGIDVYARHTPLFDDARVAAAQKTGTTISNVVLGVRASLNDQTFEGHCLLSKPHGYTAILGKTQDGQDQLSILATDQLGGTLREGAFYRMAFDDDEWVPTMMPGRESNHLMQISDQQRGVVTPERRSLVDIAIQEELSTLVAEHGRPVFYDAATIEKMQTAQRGLPVRVTARALMVDPNRRFGIGYNDEQHALVPIFLDDMPSMVATGDEVTLDLRAQGGVVRTEMARIASKFSARSSEWQEAMDAGMDTLARHVIAQRLRVPTTWLEDYRPEQNAAFSMMPLLFTNDRTYFGRPSATRAQHWEMFSISTYGPLHAAAGEQGVDAKSVSDEDRMKLVNDLRAFGEDAANGIQFSDLATMVRKPDELHHVLESGYAQFIQRGTRLEMKAMEMPPSELRTLAQQIREKPAVLFRHMGTVGERQFGPQSQRDPEVPSIDGDALYLASTPNDIVFGLLDGQPGDRTVSFHVFPLEKALVRGVDDLDLRPFETVRLSQDDNRYTIERQEQRAEQERNAATRRDQES